MAPVQVGGYVDAPALIVHPLEGTSYIFTTLSRRPFRIEPRTRALWRKLAAHLGAGCRLSGRAASPEAEDVECVMAPDGRVVHAKGDARSGQARERLRAAVRDVDRARTRRGRANPEAALELWRGLFAGRWTLVDGFDSDGKRFVLARWNDPQTATPRPLPLRQRQVLFLVAAGWPNKEVGYALGIHEATVAAHLRRALAAVGAASRSDWIRLSTQATNATSGTP